MNRERAEVTSDQLLAELELNDATMDTLTKRRREILSELRERGLAPVSEGLIAWYKGYPAIPTELKPKN